jgi:hypothetical protein
VIIVSTICLIGALAMYIAYLRSIDHELAIGHRIIIRYKQQQWRELRAIVPRRTQKRPLR